MLEPHRQDAGQRPPDGAARGRARGHAGAPRPGRASSLWGSRPGRLGVLLVIACAALGMLVTVLARTDPGPALGLFVVAGTAAATLAVRSGSVHVIIPVPALAYVVAATVAGLVHDRASDGSLTGLALHAAQWIAGGFLAMSAATLLAVAATLVRRPRGGRPRR